MHYDLKQNRPDNDVVVRRIVGLAGILLNICSPADAAEVKFISARISPTCASIELRGEIRGGDTKAFLDLVALNNRGCAGQNIEPSVLLDSEGGDVDEALRLGRVIRSNGMGTGVEPHKKCISACNFVFIAGVVRTVRGGVFGIHRPYSLSLSTEHADAASTYQRLKRVLTEYALEMNGSPELVERMMRVSPEDVEFLNAAELKRLGVTGSDPIFEDVAASNAAKELGVTKREYFRRLAMIKQICPTGARPFPDPDECADRVLRTGANR
ncbi:MAG TPA: hypothetical protein VJ733_02505 [Candidatus Binatia bacterium]|nr:hypothetical protein [Candidatus Binatia bacterium]